MVRQTNMNVLSVPQGQLVDDKNLHWQGPQRVT